MARLFNAAAKPKGSFNLYHGSPYRFSRFDPAKVGSGEGAIGARRSYEGYGTYLTDSETAARWYARHNKPPGKRSPTYYKVKVGVHPDTFLDLDRPLTQQPKPVQEALAALGFRNGRGVDIMKELGGLDPRTAKAAAERLRQVGISGVRFPNSWHLGGKAGTGYTVFDPSILEIVAKNDILLYDIKRAAGIAAGAAAGGAAALQLRKMQKYPEEFPNDIER